MSYYDLHDYASELKSNGAENCHIGGGDMDDASQQDWSCLGKEM